MRKETVSVFLCCRGAFLASHLPIKKKQKKNMEKSAVRGNWHLTKKIYEPNQLLQIFFFVVFFHPLHPPMRYLTFRQRQSRQLSYKSANCRTQCITKKIWRLCCLACFQIFSFPPVSLPESQPRSHYSFFILSRVVRYLSQICVSLTPRS